MKPSRLSPSYRLLRGAPLALLCSLSLGVPVVACSDDEGDGGHGGAGGHAHEGTGGGHDGGHGSGEEPDCKAISSVCHEVDGLSDKAADCHHIGHENDAAACAAAKDECVEHCTELAQGAGGAGGAGDGHHH